MFYKLLDWTYFLRAEIRKLQQDEVQFTIDIKRAIEAAQKVPMISPIIFNRALYTFVSGNTERAAQIYQQGLMAAMNVDAINEAMIDLDNLMKLFPVFRHGQVFREMLHAEVEKRKNRFHSR